MSQDENPSYSRYKPGHIFDGRYKIIRLLGEGGMAQVYLAEDTKLDGERVAIKLMLERYVNHEILVERFKREVNLTKNFNHPNIVRSYHFGLTEENEPYYIMEYVSGQSLDQVLKDKGKIHWKEVLRYIVEVSKALAFAHENKIIHRDIKPANILLTIDGEIKVSDFGVAKDLTAKNLTAPGGNLGSIHYKAPYNNLPEEEEHKFDIYSLGIMTFELLNGYKPFDSDSGEDLPILSMHITEPIPKFCGGKTDIPYWFQEFVEKCCAKTARECFDSVEKVLGFITDHINTSYFLVPFVALRRLIRENGFVRKLATASASIILTLLSLYPSSMVSYSGFIGHYIEPFGVIPWFFIRGPVAPPDDIVIFVADRKSQKQLWKDEAAPIPRPIVTSFLEKLSVYKPKAVILDYLYEMHSGDRAIDEKLASAISLSPTYISLVQSDDGPASSGTATYDEINPIIRKGAKGVFCTTIMTYFGVVQHFPFCSIDAIGVTPMASILYGDEANSRSLPAMFDLPNYYGGPGAIKTYPISAFLEPGSTIDFQSLKDKIIFFGQDLRIANRARVPDTFLTSYLENTPGVEIHATFLGNILKNEWLKRLPIQMELLSIITLMGLLGLAFASCNFSQAKGLLKLVFILTPAISFAFFMVNIVVPYISICLVSWVIFSLFSQNELERLGKRIHALKTKK